MDIVLVHWKIKPDMEQEFLTWWQTGVEGKPKGMIEEHISKVEPDETSTWDLASPKYLTYINVGKWEDKKLWKDAFSGQNHLMPFEESMRERIWLSVKESRA